MSNCLVLWVEGTSTGGGGKVEGGGVDGAVGVSSTAKKLPSPVQTKFTHVSSFCKLFVIGEDKYTCHLRIIPMQ